VSTVFKHNRPLPPPRITDRAHVMGMPQVSPDTGAVASLHMRRISVCSGYSHTDTVRSNHPGSLRDAKAHEGVSALPTQQVSKVDENGYRQEERVKEGK
jgi:hypothetical protein